MIKGRDRAGPLVAALVALAASLPAIALPFLADDWANLLDVATGRFTRTAFGYFRPVYLLTLWADLQVWGRSPVAFHATNILLIVLSAALVVPFARRCGATAGVAAISGVLFALHPFHVETAAWIAARGDALFCALLLASYLAYDRWARRTAGAPMLALLLFEGALLSKEAAVCYPILLPLLRFGRRDARVTRREVWLGMVPHAWLAPVHFFVVRRLALAGQGVSGPADLGWPWVKRFVHFLGASVLPLHIERFERNPRAVGLIAAFIVVTLALLARRRLGDDRRLLATLVAGFVIASAPSLLSFQERYLFFPTVFSSIALACVLAAVRPRVRVVVASALLVVWGASLWEHWQGWSEAGRVSRRLVADLTRESLDPAISEIVIANLPYRVHGAPVAGVLPAAVELSGGRRVWIQAATAIDLPSADVDGVDSWSADTVHVRVPSKLFARIFLPQPQAPGVPVESDFGVVTFDGPGSARVRLDRAPDATRRALLWKDGVLQRLF